MKRISRCSPSSPDSGDGCSSSWPWLSWQTVWVPLPLQKRSLGIHPLQPSSLSYGPPPMFVQGSVPLSLVKSFLDHFLAGGKTSSRCSAGKPSLSLEPRPSPCNPRPHLTVCWVASHTLIRETLGEEIEGIVPWVVLITATRTAFPARR